MLKCYPCPFCHSRESGNLKGINSSRDTWIPAFAGMTTYGIDSRWDLPRYLMRGGNDKIRVLIVKIV